MFPRRVWDADPWTPRGFILSDKKAGPFTLEIFWVKMVNPLDQTPQKATTPPGQSPATRPDV